MPFELGRPLGVPNPVIIHDFPEDAPQTDGNVDVLSCPVSFEYEETDTSDPLKARFIREIQAMHPWYEMALKNRNRTTVGGSSIEISSLGQFLYSFVVGSIPENPRDDVDISVTLKLAAEDLKAYYTEAVTSQPGQEGLSSNALKEWFWNQTTAGSVMLELIKVCSKSEDERIRITGSHFIAPMDVLMKNGSALEPQI